jgi:phage shock protein PspC (stress-responsive transcriptional regulator)
MPYRLPLALPRLRRAEGEGALAGVCAGIAKSLRVDPTLVRLTFALLAFAGGAGLAAYAGAWLALTPESGPRPSPRRRLLGYVALAVAGAIALRGFGFSDSLIWPAALCGAGILLARGRRGAPVVAGLSLVAVGVILFVDQNATANGRDAAFQSSAVAIALLLVLGPWAWRLAAERDTERTARIRSQERSEMAARVHDSVLQTLALVQREAGDPRRVAALARRQERELRSWLYPDAREEGAGLAAAMDAAAAEVEELHGVPVELVRTGDVPLDERVESLVLGHGRRCRMPPATRAPIRSRSSSTSATTRSRSTSATAARASTRTPSRSASTA